MIEPIEMSKSILNLAKLLLLIFSWRLKKNLIIKNYTSKEKKRQKGHESKNHLPGWLSL